MASVSEPQASSTPTKHDKPDDEAPPTLLTTQVSTPTVKTPRVEKPDLWLLAYERAGFDKDQKQVLLDTSDNDEAKPWSPLDVVEEVKDATSNRCMECSKSGWVTDDGIRRVVVAQR
jgi:hypothetical protein